MGCVTSQIDFDSFQSDPNDYSDEEFMINYENNYNVDVASSNSSLFSHEYPFEHSGLPGTVPVESNSSNNDNSGLAGDEYNSSNFNDHARIPSPFVREPFPEVDYIMIDSDIIMDNILDHVEGVLEKGDKHVCHYCCSLLDWFNQ